MSAGMPDDTELYSKSEKREKRWRCPLDSTLYRKAGECTNRCWATPGLQEQHEPVTVITTVEVNYGHEDEA